MLSAERAHDSPSPSRAPTILGAPGEWVPTHHTTMTDHHPSSIVEWRCTESGVSRYISPFPSQTRIRTVAEMWSNAPARRAGVSLSLDRALPTKPGDGGPNPSTPVSASIGEGVDDGSGVVGSILILEIQLSVAMVG